MTYCVTKVRKRINENEIAFLFYDAASKLTDKIFYEAFFDELIRGSESLIR